MKRETGWIPLSPSELWFQQDEGNLSVSPLVFDIPVAVRAVFNPIGHVLTVDLCYDSKETAQQIIVEGPVRFTVGATSGRLYTINIALSSTEQSAMRSEALKALVEAGRLLAEVLKSNGQPIGRAGELRPRMNGELARRMLVKKSDRLVHAIG